MEGYPRVSGLSRVTGAGRMFVYLLILGLPFAVAFGAAFAVVFHFLLFADAGLFEKCGALVRIASVFGLALTVVFVMPMISIIVLLLIPLAFAVLLEFLMRYW
jgi:hypothetical protein